jgi:TorA maturation chaperone TorD
VPYAHYNEFRTSTGTTGPPIADWLVHEDRVRGHVYALLGNLLAGPPDTGLRGLVTAVDVGSSGDPEFAVDWEMLTQAVSRCDAISAADEYQAVFVGLGHGEVIPYASWYLTRLLLERPIAELRGDLRALGLGRESGVGEREDHAAALCDSMALLITAQPVARIEQQQSFFSRHIESWMPRLFHDLQLAPSAHLYRSVGYLGERFLELESQAFRASMPASGAASSATGAQR